MPRFYSRSHGTALRIREHAEKGEDAILVLDELKFSRVETKACRQGKNGKLILQTEPGAGHAPEAEETGARRRRAPPWWSERPRGADVRHAPGRGAQHLDAARGEYRNRRPSGCEGVRARLRPATSAFPRLSLTRAGTAAGRGTPRRLWMDSFRGPAETQTRLTSTVDVTAGTPGSYGSCIRLNPSRHWGTVSLGQRCSKVRLTRDPLLEGLPWPRC